jgi:hypothetical protein
MSDSRTPTDVRSCAPDCAGSPCACPPAPTALAGPEATRSGRRARRVVGLRLLGVALVVTLVSGTTVALRTDDSSASATVTDTRAPERALAQDRATRFIERATRTIERAAGKVDDDLHSALKVAIDEVGSQVASTATTPRPLLRRSLQRLRAAVEHGARLDADVRHATVRHDIAQAEAAAAEAARVAAEIAAAEQAAAEKAAAEAAEAARIAAEAAAAEQAAAAEAARAAASKGAAGKAPSTPATQSPDAPAPPPPPPAPSIHEIGEATLRGLPGNGGVSLSWDDPGLSGHLGGVWKGNTSTILVNASRLAGQPSKTKDVIRHEMAHIYQGRLMAAYGKSWSEIDGLMAAAYGSNASEKAADCVALRFGASWVNYTSDCSGADKQAWVDGLIGGYLP